MSKISSFTKDKSVRVCPKCGSGNGLRTQKMAGKLRAVKKCHSCGFRCIVNYKTRKVEQLKNEKHES